ncbi:Hypothetical_protein [Hexamita inflata]|uniref:Hypothetical_protein n=1 Tax=Hexamita inflata TaxID=28002 RepID=A0AA86URP4_9EUKA|nr:Hypothetical protein HINF_LOCUS49606 [Hexamita inflata]
MLFVLNEEELLGGEELVQIQLEGLELLLAVKRLQRAQLVSVRVQMSQGEVFDEFQRFQPIVRHVQEDNRSRKGDTCQDVVGHVAVSEFEEMREIGLRQLVSRQIQVRQTRQMHLGNVGDAVVGQIQSSYVQAAQEIQ